MEKIIVCAAEYGVTWETQFLILSNFDEYKMPGASVRNSAHGKGHE